MTNEEQAQEALAALRSADAGTGPSASVESAVLAAFDAHHAVRTDWSRWGAIAAMLTVAVGLSLFVADSGQRPAASGQRTAPPEVGDFVAWPGAASLPEFEAGELVRTRLPVTALPLLGISPADALAVDGHVFADVLYGQDGQPRVVRVVNGTLTP